MITLRGNPQSTNHLYKSHCRFGYPTVYMSKKGKDLKEDYQWQLKSQWREGILTGPVKLKIALYFKNKLRRDIDNYQKITFDSMSGIVMEDDVQIQEIEIKKGIDKLDPRIEIIVEKL